ncbi:MAG: NMD3-related protein, partial [Candidatus Thermoplasmatota archaeon]|nr:NMD3-related protein [Candidatus Thermoplasmatota archaeon]
MMEEAERPTTDAFCIRCGGPDPVADGECAECLTRELTVVRAPENRVIVEICRHCGATPYKSSWKAPPSRAELVERSAIKSLAVPEALEDMRLAVHLEEHAEDAFTVLVDVSGTYKGVPVQSEAEVEVRV